MKSDLRTDRSRELWTKLRNHAIDIMKLAK
jgi:hypothetical protein